MSALIKDKELETLSGSERRYKISMQIQDLRDEIESKENDIEKAKKMDLLI